MAKIDLELAFQKTVPILQQHVGRRRRRVAASIRLVCRVASSMPLSMTCNNNGNIHFNTAMSNTTADMPKWPVQPDPPQTFLTVIMTILQPRDIAGASKRDEAPLMGHERGTMLTTKCKDKHLPIFLPWHNGSSQRQRVVVLVVKQEASPIFSCLSSVLAVLLVG